MPQGKNQTTIDWLTRVSHTVGMEVPYPTREQLQNSMIRVLTMTAMVPALPSVFARAQNESRWNALVGDFDVWKRPRHGTTVFEWRKYVWTWRGIHPFEHNPWPGEEWISYGPTQMLSVSGWLRTIPLAHPAVLLDPDIHATLVAQAIWQAIKHGGVTLRDLFVDWWAKGNKYRHPADMVLYTYKGKKRTIHDAREDHIGHLENVAKGAFEKAYTVNLKTSVKGDFSDFMQGNFSRDPRAWADLVISSRGLPVQNELGAAWFDLGNPISPVPVPDWALPPNLRGRTGTDRLHFMPDMPGVPQQDVWTTKPEQDEESEARESESRDTPPPGLVFPEDLDQERVDKILKDQQEKNKADSGRVYFLYTYEKDLDTVSARPVQLA